MDARHGGRSADEARADVDLIAAGAASCRWPMPPFESSVSAQPATMIFDAADFDDHEQVTFCRDAKSGLRAIVAVHFSGPIGTAGGGCRMAPYPDERSALADALRLSRAMSYKLVLADVPGGGAKSVIIGDPRKDKTPALLRSFGRAIDGLGGRYVAGEDVGTNAHDMAEIGKETDYVVAGETDTSIPTGQGVFLGLRAAVRRVLGRDVAGLHVAIQGVGGVGRSLGRALKDAGARLTIADPDPKARDAVAAELGAAVVHASEIYDVDADVLAPCALGSVIDDATIARLKVALVAGGANVQLARDEHAERLAARGIVFVPDFVLNAGGVLAAAQTYDRFEDGSDAPAPKLERIVQRLDDIFAQAERDGVTPYAAAVAMAKARIEAAREE